APRHAPAARRGRTVPRPLRMSTGRVALHRAAFHHGSRRGRQSPSSGRTRGFGAITAPCAPSPGFRGPSDITQPTMRELSITGRGWISMNRVQLLASKTVEGEDAVTVREMHAT